MTSPRSVSPFARAASTDIRPNDGPNSIDVTTGLFERSASAKRSHKPSEAESETTAHPRSPARRCSSLRRTVLPQPRFPVMSMSLPGAPAPLSSPSSKSSITDSRPISIGGRLPAVGLKGFGFMSASSDWQTLPIVIPTYTELYQQQVTKRPPFYHLWPKNSASAARQGRKVVGSIFTCAAAGTSYHLTV